MVRFRLALVLFSSITYASPTKKRYIDLDNNGVPDFCTTDSDGVTQCLENGSWTTVTTTSAAPGISPTKTALTAAKPTGQLPSVDQFKQDNGTKWTLEYVGDIQFTGQVGRMNVTGDKCRSSRLGDKIVWNCGDMMCNGDYRQCGFAMGPAFYGTTSVMTINTDDVSNLADHDFVRPWDGDPNPVQPQSIWGMDTSNIAAINETHGVAYAWEIWRGAPDASYVDRGNAVASVTLGELQPQAHRVGPLLTGPEFIQLGLVAILRDQDFVYIYSAGGPSGLTVSRVPATDAVFDPSEYETLEYNSASWKNGIPKQSDDSHGMTTANPSGKFGCAVYGSIFFNNYLNKYTIICSIYQSFVNMYTSDTPYGPWSAEYSLLSGWHGYGSMAHPAYSPDGSHKVLYFSQGPNAKFNMFKLTLNY